MQYWSIWEDAFYTITGVTQATYLIYNENSELIYAGVAVARPNEGGCKINVSRIVQNYLNSNLPNEVYTGSTLVNGQYYEPNAVLGFTLADEKGTVLETYKFLNCWDYVTHFAFIANPGVPYPLSKPANSHSVAEMYHFHSVLTKTNQVRTTISEGLVGDYCGYGALYYSNNMGGWDQFLIEGTITKKDTYERYTINNKWEAGTLKPGTRTLVNTIDESWSLKTHMLNDSEANILAENLYGSNNIFFHNFADGKITPVVITDTSVEYKNWRNQKKKKFYLTINIKSTQPKQRI